MIVKVVCWDTSIWNMVTYLDASFTHDTCSCNFNILVVATYINCYTTFWHTNALCIVLYAAVNKHGAWLQGGITQALSLSLLGIPRNYFITRLPRLSTPWMAFYIHYNFISWEVIEIKGVNRWIYDEEPRISRGVLINIRISLETACVW